MKKPAKKPKAAPKSPGRGKKQKAERNAMLPDGAQGRHYRVCEFVLQPVLLMYDKDGQEDGRRQSLVSLTVPPSAFGKTLPDIMKEAGLLMEDGKPQ